MIGSLPDETLASAFQDKIVPIEAPSQVLNHLSMLLCKQR